MDVSELLQKAIKHHEAGELSLAKPLYNTILEKYPENFETLFLLGTLSLETGELDKAASLLESAVSIRPDHVESQNNLGIVLLTQQKFNEAKKSFEQAVHYKPEYFDAHFNLGVTQYHLGNFNEAVESYKATIKHKPAHGKAYYNMGVIFHEQGRLDNALTCYTRAVSLQPDYVLAINNLGDVFQKLEKYTEATACFNRAISIQPDFAESHYNLGITYHSAGDKDKAISSYKNAIKYRPDYVEAHYNLGNLYSEEWRLGEAANCYRHAIKLRPDYVEAHNNLGEILQKQGKLDESIASYTMAFECKPDYIEARFHRSIALLLKGDFENGWKEYEHRLSIKKYNKRLFEQPIWDGADLKDKIILVHAEQGFGDTFHFLRLLPMVKSKGGHVIFECQPGLAHLLERCNGFDEIVEKSSDEVDGSESDVFAPLMSLPHILGITLENIPVNFPYIWADPELIAKWRDKLNVLCDNKMSGNSKPFKIGLVWGGKPERKYDKVRSCPLSLFEPLGKIENTTIFSLQKGDAAKQIGELDDSFTIIDLGKELDITDKFADTAAVIESLDLVISVDSAVAHLAGALGKPVWTIIPYAHDWRWLTNRNDSPWYPNMRLFRQTKLLDWKSVIDNVAVELDKLVNGSV